MLKMAIRRQEVAKGPAAGCEARAHDTGALCTDSAYAVGAIELRELLVGQMELEVPSPN